MNEPASLVIEFMMRPFICLHNMLKTLHIDIPLIKPLNLLGGFLFGFWQSKKELNTNVQNRLLRTKD